MSRLAHSLLKGSFSPVRLRVAFSGLGVILLSILGVVAGIAQQRLEEAQKEREQMVASRVFDEMEREVSAFLELENDRPNYAYIGQTNPETWAPFVVGYFSQARAGATSSAQIVVAEGNSSENRRRVDWALREASDKFAARVDPGEPAPLPASPEPYRSPGAVTSPPQVHPAEEHIRREATRAQTEGALPLSPSKPSSDREIIESLNRAPERRKSKSSAPGGSKTEDPFGDYSRAY